MSLTGLPLLVTGGVLTVALVAATMLTWRRRPALRALALLLTETVALLTVAVGANRSLELYPSWSVLLGTVPRPAPAAAAAPPPAAGLEEGLRADRLTFAWKPAGWESWRLAAAPLVTVAPAYLRDTAARFPVVVVVAGPAKAGWDDRHPPQVEGAIAVYLRVTEPAAAVPALTTALPEQLGRDLRVQPMSWAVAGIGPGQPLALDLVGSGPYRSAALVDGGHGTPPVVRERMRQVPAGREVGAVTSLAAALRWLHVRLPAPLAAPVVDPVP